MTRHGHVDGPADPKLSIDVTEGTLGKESHRLCNKFESEERLSMV
ncbi:hypothetical protein BO443_60340 [Burkholderia orbicola]